AVSGINDDEIIDLADYAVEKNLILRFIEEMPFNISNKNAYISAAEVIKILCSHFGEAKTIEDKLPLISAGSGPASMYHFENSGLVAGFITPMSNHFCGSCNRLRVTADGKLKPCLLSNQEFDLKLKLRDGSSDEEIRLILESTISGKPEKHKLDDGSFFMNRGMSKIGG
ncbi:MAG: hypothetical protein PF518_14865, partial [Spirochaetaceae bacterium]|nr:hypothetical protein [Spirochaetaceae bacterium]